MSDPPLPAHSKVGSTAVAAPPATVIGILEHTKLMQPSKSDSRALHITDTGYEFMLKDIHAQTWIFVLEYMKDIDRKGILPADEMLQFFDKVMSQGSDRAAHVKPSRFYTTSLAVNLIFGGMLGQTRANMTMSQGLDHITNYAADPSKSRLPSASPARADSSLLIVVETNFKVYAYTQSSLHIAMLSVFVDIVARLPNLAVGFLTRESIRSALSNGISAEQIYDFLMQHAHPKMLGNSPVIPENIADQLYLWQRERNRIKFEPGELVDVANEDFDAVVKHAEDMGVLLWHDAMHLRLVVTKAGGDAV
ncbi:hypothetical protein DYB32_005074, partial [Aphanomyces invadans]